MPKYYCGKDCKWICYCLYKLLIYHILEYCDIFLTHDSCKVYINAWTLYEISYFCFYIASVRKAHNAGKNHILNVRNYYAGKHTHNSYQKALIRLTTFSFLQRSVKIKHKQLLMKLLEHMKTHQQVRSQKRKNGPELTFEYSATSSICWLSSVWIM